MESLAQKFKNTGLQNEKLQEISFAGRAIKMNKREDAQEIVDAINKSQVVEVLTLDGNTMGVEAAELIGDALSKHKEFKRAKWSDMFTGRLKTEIPPALKHLCSGIIKSGAELIELDLSDNAFGPIGVEGISELLLSKSCYSLKELRLNNNGLGPNGGKMLAALLDKLYEESKSVGKPFALTTFVSGRGRLENEGAMALSKVFQKMGSLEFVSMPQNGINPDGIKALSAAFAFNKNLKHLNMCDNTFTVSGAVAMSKALPSLTKLEMLNLESCLIRSKGASAIANALTANFKQLKEVNCKYNEITVDGAIRLVESAAYLPGLTSLQLDGNNLGEEGCEVVRDTLESCDKPHLVDSLSEDEGSLDGDEDEGSADEAAGEPASIEKISPADFMSSPSLEMAACVSAADYTQYLSSKLSQQEDQAAQCNLIIGTCFKLGALLNQQSNEEPSKAVLSLCESCLKTDKQSDLPSSIFSNSILVNLSLIKSEDKKFKPVTSDMNGPVIVLAHLVKQDLLPPPVCQTLNTFIKICGKNLNTSMKARYQLEQALFTKI